MADDGGGKRLKKSPGGGLVNTELRRRISELESENEQLRRRGRQEGNHEVLPVVVVATVDLSRIDTSIVTHISSFLGTSRELLNLGLTCKSFGFRQPTSTRHLSLVEEVARRKVCSSATDAELDHLPQYVSGTTTWLSILHRFDHLLIFDVLLGGNTEHQNGDKTTVCGKSDYRGVGVLSSYVMRSGSHYVEFQITRAPRRGPCIGIVRPMPGLDAGAYRSGFDFTDFEFYPDFLAQRSDDWGNGNVHACEYYSKTGAMSWTDWDDDEDEENCNVDWEGMEGCESGDTVGMLLNLDEGTLTVYKDNRCLGVLKDGLSGSYCWYADVSFGDAVAIQRNASPTSPTTSIERLY